jgi:hypothetical protein
MKHEPIKDIYWVGIDLDNCLANNSAHPEYELLEPIEGAKEALEELVRRGYKPIIFTARSWADYDYIEKWLEFQEIPFRRIICGKPLLFKMHDDKNVNFRKGAEGFKDLLNECPER